MRRRPEGWEPPGTSQNPWHAYDHPMIEAADEGGAADLGRLTGWNRAPSGKERTEYVVDATAEVLQAAARVPEQVDVFGETLVINTEAYRDFMPGNSTLPQGSPLMVHIEVKSTKRGRLPPLLVPEWVAVIHGDQIWVTPGAIENLSYGFGNSDRYVVRARYGPLWGPDIEVDVLLQLRDRDGAAYRLRSTGVSVIGSS
jgi:hypothetical protein